MEKQHLLVAFDDTGGEKYFCLVNCNTSRQTKSSNTVQLNQKHVGYNQWHSQK